MVWQHFLSGLRSIRYRLPLVGLVYAANLLVALVLSVPVYVALQQVVGPHGFGAELAAGFDLVLWKDVMEPFGVTLAALSRQLLWMVPLYLIWKVALSVGLIHALGRGGRPFWPGVGRHTRRGLLLALLFLVTLGGVALLTALFAMALNLLWGGPVGTFWVNAVLVPTCAITGLAVTDLMHDYGRMALVLDHRKVWAAWWIGMKWPFRHGRASRLYVAWFALAAVLLALPTVLDMNVAAATGGTVWLLFLVQQLLLFGRAAVTVGWFGSEVAFYEHVQMQAAPLIAKGRPPVASPVSAPFGASTG